MSSTQVFVPQLNTVDSIVNYLREDISTEVVSSTTPSTVIDSSKRPYQQNKKQKKEKEQANLLNSLETIQVLSTGRVRYGPVTVNPRKQPSKTLFTGRRSKYEVLQGEEEEKRRLRRDRNRIAATKCREKRDKILLELQQQCSEQEKYFQEILIRIEQLKKHKEHLESLLSQSAVNYPAQIQQNSSNIYLQPDFYTSKTILSSEPLQLIANNEEEFHEFLQPEPVLTNSTIENDPINYLFNSQLEQEQQQQQITMTSSSFNRLFGTTILQNDLHNNPLTLFNSTYGSSTCARQYSSSSSNEDDSMPSTQRNSFVC